MSNNADAAGTATGVRLLTVESPDDPVEITDMMNASNLIRVSRSRMGQRRGKPRFYLEGLYLLSAGFEPAKLIEAEFKKGKVILRVSPKGSRVVTHKHERPVIDLNTNELREAFGDVDTLQVKITRGEIILTPILREEKRRSRCRNGYEGSLFSGGGLMSKAAELAGFKPRFAVEIDKRFAESYSRNFPDSVMFNMPVEQVPLEDLPPVEILTVGIPCAPFSTLRRTERGTSARSDKSVVPEAHEEGDMTLWAALVINALNPATVVIEEAAAWLTSASGFVMRHFLERLGYNISARVVDAFDYGELQHRRRTVMIAHSETDISWPPECRSERQLGDILESEEIVRWWTRETKSWVFQQWSKHAQSGNNFRSAKLTAASSSVAAIKKMYLGTPSSDCPVVCHPTKPETYRWFTLNEVRRLFGVPDDFILPDVRSVAGAILGQGVIVSLFRRIIEAATARNNPRPELDDGAQLGLQMAFGFQ